MKAATSLNIKAPIDDVFAAFSDIEHRQKYLGAVISVKITSTNKKGDGVSWHEERRENDKHIKGDLTITRYNPPKSFAIITKSAGLEYRTNYNFQVVSPMITKVVITMGGKPGGLLGRFMSRFLTENNDFLRKELQNHLQEYKSAIEAE